MAPLTPQSCCTAKCEDDSQVPCTWSSTGKEYSGRIDVTAEGQKCVNWLRSLHKHDTFVVTIHGSEAVNDARKDFYMPDLMEYRYDILSQFPDHSLDEAAGILQEIPVVHGVILHMLIKAEVTVIYLNVTQLIKEERLVVLKVA